MVSLTRELFFSFRFSFMALAPSSSSSTSSVSLHHLTTLIPLKLDDENFLLWKQQVLATVDGLLLSSFLDGTNVPTRCLSAADGTLSPNLIFISYKQQDNLLVACFLASMTTPILTQMVGLTSAAQIWHTLNTYFSSHARAQIKKLKLLLKNPKKDRSISAYVWISDAWWMRWL